MGNLFENFKNDILSTLSSQLDGLPPKKNREEFDKAMAVFCSKFRKKYPLRECPTDNIEVC